MPRPILSDLSILIDSILKTKLENLKKNQRWLLTIEMKNTLKGINRILDGIEERISDPEDRILEVLGS